MTVILTKFRGKPIMGMLLLFIFIAVPVIEIGLFIQVGGLLGLFPTLFIVIITAIIGTYLLRQQGLGVLMKLQTEFQSGQLPIKSLIHGAFIVVAGLLLLTPGFFTDFIGFSLFIPQVRLAFAHVIARQFKNAQAAGNASSFQFYSSFDQKGQHDTGFKAANDQNPNGQEIEGEFERVEEIEDTGDKAQDVDLNQSKPKDSPWSDKN